MKKVSITFLLFLSVCVPYAQEQVKSPDGRLVLGVLVQDSLRITLAQEGQQLLAPSPIAMQWGQSGTWGKSPEVTGINRRSVDTVLHPPYGIQNKIRDHYNELVLHFSAGFRLRCRAYNEGLAYRFEGAGGAGDIVVDELLRLNWNQPQTIWASDHKAWQQAFEGAYTPLHKKDIAAGRRSITPLLMLKKDAAVLLTEANLHDYPGMFVQSTEKLGVWDAEFAPYVEKTAIPLKAWLSPVKMPYFSNKQVKKRAGYIAKTQTDRAFPWRVFVVAGQQAGLMEQSLVWQLAPPQSEMDFSWVKPGKVVWDWYHYWKIPDVGFNSGVNTRTYKYYVDFAAEHGFEYINLDFSWSPLWNLSRSRRKVDVEEIIAYADSRGVGVFLWAIWYELDSQLETYLDQFADWGVAGLKVDFMDRNDQAMTRFYERLARESAERQILLNLHGAYKPTGLARKYPNVINREGVLGLENNKFSDRCTPRHNAMLPFVRNAVGPMDYTPGAMRHTTPDEFEKNWRQPVAMTTRMQQIAMYVVYYGPLQMISDAPTLYPESVLGLLGEMPVSWDETRGLQGRVGEYAVVARRKGKVWYVAGLNNNQQRALEIPLGFLPAGHSYNATTWQDGNKFDAVGVQVQKLRAEDGLKILMAPAGGFVTILKPLE